MYESSRKWWMNVCCNWRYSFLYLFLIKAAVLIIVHNMLSVFFCKLKGKKSANQSYSLNIKNSPKLFKTTWNLSLISPCNKNEPFQIITVSMWKWLNFRLLLLEVKEEILGFSKSWYLAHSLDRLNTGFWRVRPRCQ